MADTNLLSHLALPDDLRSPADGLIPHQPERILLTGATGYLGAYLLAALLVRSTARIVCLVRAQDASSAMARLRDNLVRYELPADLDRVDVVVGAVEAPQLGLGDSEWQALARDIDVIVDAAASVNFLSPLNGLLPINVGGPINLLRLAGAVRPKPLHLSSSYSVFNEKAYAGVTTVSEDPLVGDGEGFRGGYPASKWIAERVSDLARERGWNVTTHRLGYLWGDTRTGRSKPDDALTLNVRACLMMGKAQDVDVLMHITPVDFAAAAMAEIAVASTHSNRHYHTLTDAPITWREFMRGVQAHGHAMELVPYGAWHGALRELLPAHREFTALALSASLDPERGASTNISRMHFDTSRLRLALAPVGLACPPMDQPLIGTYSDAMARENSSAS
jgi:thioester reductase-like protein